MGNYPPMLPRTRPYIYVLRAIGLGFLVVGLWTGWNYVETGESVTGIRIIGAAVAFALGTWVSIYSPLFLVLLAVPLLILPLSAGSGVVFAIIAAVFFLALTLRKSGPVSIDPGAVRRGADDAVMPHAIRFVGEFESFGWRRIGAVVADVGSIEVTIAVLLSPDQRSYVEVTDVVVAITSTFAHGRTLVTRNSASSPMAPWALANDHRGASPGQLAASHQEVLDLLKERGIVSSKLDPATLIQLVIEMEKLSIEEAAGFRPGIANTAKGQGPIERNEASAERIRRWSHSSGPEVSSDPPPGI